MDPQQVRAAVESGVAFPCAMCVHHWHGRDAGQESCGRPQCGGPVSGLAFPEYKGPLPSGDWGHFCFLTGKPDDLIGVKVAGSSRMLAVVREQKKIFEQCTVVPGAIDCIQVPRAVLLIDKATSDTRQTNTPNG